MWTAAVCTVYCAAGIQDWKTRIVSNRRSTALLLLGLFQWSAPGLMKILGLLFPIVATLLLDRVMRTKSGGADVKMYAATGFMFGLGGLVCIWAVTFIIVLMWLLVRKAPLRTKLPMCSFLAVGGCVYTLLLMMK